MKEGAEGVGSTGVSRDTNKEILSLGSKPSRWHFRGCLWEGMRLILKSVFFLVPPGWFSVFDSLACGRMKIMGAIDKTSLVHWFPNI